MPATDCDVLIVGARVAGSSLAIRLAEQGRKVLVVDQQESRLTVPMAHP